MITNYFMVTISHSDSRLRLIRLGIYYYSFTALEVYILTNILLLMYKSIFNINGPILFGLCFRLPIRQRPIRVALNRESYRSDSTENEFPITKLIGSTETDSTETVSSCPEQRTIRPTKTESLDRDHESHHTEILTEITGLLSCDRMYASKSESENHAKTF